MRVTFDLEAPGPDAAGPVSIRSIVGEATVSTLERIDTVELGPRCAAEYSGVLCSHHLGSHRATGLQRTVLGSLRHLQVASAVGRALTDPARSALYRST